MSKISDLMDEVTVLRAVMGEIQEQVLFAQRERRYTDIVLGRIQVLAENALDSVITVDPNTRP